MQKLDLHGVAHEDVEWEVIRFIERNWHSEDDIEVVTGNSAIMRNIVKGVIEEYKLDFTIGQIHCPNCGSIRIHM